MRECAGNAGLCIAAERSAGTAAYDESAMSLRSTALLVALAASSLAWGEALDPRERLAYLSHVEGPVTFRGAGVPASSLPDRPLRRGDRLTSDGGGRAELWVGATVVRLDERSELSIARLEDSRVQLALERGVLSLHVRALLTGETIEVATPLRTLSFAEPGEYRVEVPARDSTALTVYAGAAYVATEDGPVRVTAGQRVQLEGRNGAAHLAAMPRSDSFDEWILSREVQLAEAEPSPEDGLAYEDLDRYGDWYGDSTYGRVWSPYYTNGWNPVRDRYWRQDGFGWSWVISGPWGFVTFRSGHWSFIDHLNRWCWVPRPVQHSEGFARETHPFGRATVQTGTQGLGWERRTTIQSSGGGSIHESGKTIFRSFGGSGQSAGSSSSGGGRSSATMRPSGSSYSRGSSSSSSSGGSSSVFAGPGSR